MGSHQKIVAALHIVAGSFVAALVLALWVCAAWLAPLFDGSDIPELVGWIGRPVAIALLACCVLEITATISWLRQRRWAWPALAAVACLQMAVFPIGSALAAYTLWVLARTRHAAPPQAP